MQLHFWKSIALCIFIANVGSADDVVRVLQGKVVAANGAPVEAALIEWGYFNTPMSRCETARTGRDGSYRLESVKVGPEFRLGVSAPGFAPVWIDHLIPGRADNPDTRTITLRPGGTISGVVVDENDIPLERITILAKCASKGAYSSFSMPSASFRFPGPAHTALTDSEGQFRIPDLPCVVSTVVGKSEDGELIVEDKPREFTLYWKTSRAISRRGNAICGEPARIVIKRQWLGTQESSPGVVRGRVLDSITNQPIEEFKVGLRYRPGLRTFNDSEGQFVLEGLVAGRPYEVHVFADGYAPGLAGADDERTAAAKCYVNGGVIGTSQDDERVFECRLERSPSYRGRVVSSDGTPISGAEIVFGIPGKRSSSDFHWAEFSKYADGHMGLEHVQRTTTAGDGSFSFSEGPTKGVMAIIDSGHGRVFVTADNRPAPNENSVATVELVDADASIAGTVRRNSEPDANVSISAWTRSNSGFGGYSVRAKTDENGRFQLLHLEAGEYLVSVSEILGNSVRDRITHRLSLAPGEDKSVDLGSADGPFTLSGTAPPFSWIQLKLKAEESSIMSQGTFSNADGKYAIEEIHPGTYELRARSKASTLTGYMGRKLKSREIVVDHHLTENISWR
jgi:hypothetical protein